MNSKYAFSVSSCTTPRLGHGSTRGEGDKPRFGAKLRLVALGIAAVAGLVVAGYTSGRQIPARSPQAAGASVPSFEVASIKRSGSGENTEFHILPDRLTVRNYLLAYLVGFAYGRDLGEFGFLELRHNQVVGGPRWINPGEFDYEGYDIDAKVDDSLAAQFGQDCGMAFFRGRCAYRQQMISMLQSLLADRFKLKVRRETEEGPVYALVVAKGGPKFQASLPPDADSREGSKVPAPKRPPCPAGVLCYQDYLSMGRLAAWLSDSRGVDRPVIDQTGLEGGYYIKIQWAPEQRQAEIGSAASLGPPGPDIFAALQQQLGLKLKPTKGPVETLVIEHIERPSEN